MKAFLVAGNATFTIVGSRNRFTYKVQQARDDQTLYFVKVSASDHTFYLGTLRATPAGLRYALGRKSTITAEALSHRAFDFFIKSLEAPTDQTFKKMGFYHEGKCGRCGRPLTDPESINTGIGPICRTR